ncbi:MAG: 4Fe-4S binding protein [Coriobacteriales bacterium]
MKVKVLKTLVPVAVLLVLAAGLAFNYGTGTLSAFGWRDISLLCPLGAITSMLAEKTIIPRAVFAMALVVIVILLTGRAFCSWICPVPLVSKLRTAFSPKKKPASEGAEGEGGAGAPQLEVQGAGCAACSSRLSRVDSRHLILGGSLLSAAIFGFPVFCLVCPIGLTFGTILLLVALFGYGDVTWSVIFVPVLLLVEVVFFKKWCSKICPMGALLGLIGRLNRTLRPTVDKNLCLEQVHGAHCGVCTRSCEQGINLRDKGLGASRGECTRCLACMQNCPAHAVKLALIADSRRYERRQDQQPTAE